MAKKKQESSISSKELFNLESAFNDMVMRELGLDLDENNHVVSMDTMEIFQIKDKFIKYKENEYDQVYFNEIELNLLENPRMMEILYGIWLNRREAGRGIEITSIYQSQIRGSNKGFFVTTYMYNGESDEAKSDVFINESVRVFNLITKIRHTDHLYDFAKYDIEIERRK